jgi:hypothetical protein
MKSLQIGRPLLNEELQTMSRRLDFNQDFRNRQAKYGLSIKDETEWMENDAAARWLRKKARHAAEKADHRPSGKRPASSETKLTPRKRPKHKHADLDPRDPHDQLPGVDMKRVPWR